VEETEMKKTLKIVYLMTLVISLLMANLVYAAEPTVTTEPEEIVKQSTFTFTVELDDEDVTSVWLFIQECDASTGTCFPETIQNISMTEQDGKYQTPVTISHERASYIQYTINVETSEGWESYLKLTKIYLTEVQNGNGTDNGDNGNGSPGFELITLLAAVVIGIILLRKKRF
jgi:hypothetical protein